MCIAAYADACASSQTLCKASLGAAFFTQSHFDRLAIIVISLDKLSILASTQMDVKLDWHHRRRTRHRRVDALGPRVCIARCSYAHFASMYICDALSAPGHRCIVVQFI